MKNKLKSAATAMLTVLAAAVLADAAAVGPGIPAKDQYWNLTEVHSWTMKQGGCEVTFQWNGKSIAGPKKALNEARCVGGMKAGVRKVFEMAGAGRAMPTFVLGYEVSVPASVPVTVYLDAFGNAFRSDERR